MNSIDRIAAPGSSPTSVADYSAIVAQLAAIVLDKEAPIRILGSSVLAGSFLSIGGVLYIVNGDAAISGTASDYVKITPSGASATASFVADLTGVTWNDAFKGYYDVSGNLYIFDELKGRALGALAGVNKENLGIKNVDIRALKLLANPDYISGALGIAYDAGSTLSSGGYTPITGRIYIQRTGTVRVVFSLKSSSQAQTTVYGCIYKNASASGTERSTIAQESYTEDVSVAMGDYLQVYAYGDQAQVSTVIVSIGNAL